MNKKNYITAFFSSEARIFILLWLVYMLLPYLVVPDRYGYSLGLPELVIKSVYLLPILFNNLLLIPRYLYKSKYVRYGLFFVGIIIAVSVLEELVLENIFYPTTRGGDFSARGLQNAATKIGFAFVFFGSFKVVWDYQKKQQQVGELEKEKVESELKFLKSQINPHVLFNNLNNIYSYALEKSEKVPQMLLKLSDIMRYMLKEGTGQMVTLSKELKYLEDFIELQKLRMEGRGEVRFRVKGHPENYKIAPLLLVSFVENSFKHSMQSEIDQIIIDISIEIENGSLSFKARNTYSDENPEVNGQSETGIGLQNVKKRLQLIYDGEHELNITNDDGLFTVFLTINLTVDEPEVLDY